MEVVTDHGGDCVWKSWSEMLPGGSRKWGLHIEIPSIYSTAWLEGNPVCICPFISRCSSPLSCQRVTCCRIVRASIRVLASSTSARNKLPARLPIQKQARPGQCHRRDAGRGRDGRIRTLRGRGHYLPWSRLPSVHLRERVPLRHALE